MSTNENVFIVFFLTETGAGQNETVMGVCESKKAAKDCIKRELARVQKEWPHNKEKWKTDKKNKNRLRRGKDRVFIEIREQKLLRENKKNV